MRGTVTIHGMHSGWRLAIFGWTAWAAATLALAQEVPFPAEPAAPWKPSWELSLRADRITDKDLQREDLQLRLRWTVQGNVLRLEAGTRSALGSDGNRFNPYRWDQQPSNGTQVDVAHVDATGVTASAFGTARLGFQENTLLASQALWDRNLRFLGASMSGGLRSPGGRVQEAGIRLEAGQVRTVLGGDPRLAAAQAVLKLDTGPLSWTAHGGRWTLVWDRGEERQEAVPGHEADPRQHLGLWAWGAGVRWNSPTPLEAHWFQARNGGTGEDSEEFQLSAGSRARPWRPQLMYTWQRLSATGTLYPVNGDEWWFYRSAWGPRVDLALPLSGQWLVSLTWLRQREDGQGYAVQRKMLNIMKRF